MLCGDLVSEDRDTYGLDGTLALVIAAFARRQPFCCKTICFQSAHLFCRSWPHPPPPPGARLPTEDRGIDPLCGLRSYCVPGGLFVSPGALLWLGRCSAGELLGCYLR